MIQLRYFTFSPFQENSYVLWDDEGTCIVLDPGCYDHHEWDRLRRFLDENELRPTRLINTHCHLDHIFGNHYIESAYGLLPEFHEAEMPVFTNAGIAASMYGVRMVAGQEPERFLTEKDTIAIGGTELRILFTPGHSPGSLSFYNERDGWVISGDVLFQQSIGRTDLPGGDYDTLIRSIFEKLMPLPDDTTVFSGHGPETTIGYEKRNNPFLVG
jgi:glyoxylase-like metal-dependent hydrolase (beta-lactamase superfamily II)